MYYISLKLWSKELGVFDKLSFWVSLQNLFHTHTGLIS